MVGQPHSDDEGPIAEAERRAADLRDDEQPLGPPGHRLDWRSPFFVGLAGAAGVAVTYGAVRGLVLVSSMLVLIGVAFFVALGLEPAVSWLVNHKLRRWAAVTVVLVVVFAVLAGSLAAAIPPLAQQARQFVDQAPHYIQQVQDHSSWIGKLNDRFHLQQRITETVNGAGGSAVAEVVKAGTVIFGALADLLIVAVLTVYFLADMPRIRATLYRLVPHSRRPRAILIGDQVYAKVGAYVLGNVVISVIAGVATFLWLVVFGIPYPLLLGIFVALLDLIPFGSTVAGLIVAAVALTVSLPVALATVGFYVVFRLAEDYLLVPKIIGRAVRVPAVATLLAVLVGGALLGIVGALVAIPIAAAVQLLVQEVLYPRLDEL
ncbi:AI-2E family transporter [Mycobacterium sp.]|jgi:predicted PurR-regulated permease PerM|uniref:AI-2E family transporter n=1 Tax=Mycobacterium sp. TaxID=1785 RepID=UPI002D3ED76A|nr:AI-2E family transporter [Mycobacterium sp.]HZA12489.1 AI-2E family transporter [Mycobacterium sp.]